MVTLIGMRNPIAEEHVPVVRRALAASDERVLQALGQPGTIDYLVDEKIIESAVTVYDSLIAAERAGMCRIFAVERMQRLRDALAPFVGQRLLRTAMWHAGSSYGIYIDPVSERIVHWSATESPNPSGTENDRMPIRWPTTVLERTSEPYAWIETNLFPHEFLEPRAFETAEVLYRCELSWNLLELVVFGRPQPAPFSQADLNAAILDACRASGFEPAAYWWSVNVHDGCFRVVEQVGTYSFRDPLEPLFIQLAGNPAKEGGVSYAGLLDREYRWALSLASGNQFFIRVHGPASFCQQAAAALAGR